jgi:hypothetical protein
LCAATEIARGATTSNAAEAFIALMIIHSLELIVYAHVHG